MHSRKDIMFDNYFNTSNDPHATTNGLIWIDTGNGVPFRVPNLAVINGDSYPPPASDTIWDLNIELLGGTTSSDLALLVGSPDGGQSDAAAFTSLLLKDIPFSDNGTPNAGQYDTSFSPTAGGFSDSSECYKYIVPGSTGSGYFQLRVWSGDFTSFNAALAGARYVGETPVFANPVGYYIDPPQDLVDMPALTIRQYLPGDANLDGKVNINDLTIVLANYGQNGTMWSQGEFTGDGTVDINDLTIVLAHYGQSLGSSAGGMAAVPEPSVITLLLAGAVSVLGYGWRQRRAGQRDG